MGRRVYRHEGILSEEDDGADGVGEGLEPRMDDLEVDGVGNGPHEAGSSDGVPSDIGGLYGRGRGWRARGGRRMGRPRIRPVTPSALVRSIAPLDLG